MCVCMHVCVSVYVCVVRAFRCGRRSGVGERGLEESVKVWRVDGVGVSELDWVLRRCRKWSQGFLELQ